MKTKFFMSIDGILDADILRNVMKGTIGVFQAYPSR